MLKYGAFYITLSFTLSTLSCFSYPVLVRNNFLQNVTRIRRETETCGRFQFKCKSGECIGAELYCNGKENCKDGSDETDDCKSIPCEPYLFKCSYGACINGDYECDGKQDCKDNSDETSPKCVNTAVAQCSPGTFKCKSGQCINSVKLCDGKVDCNDGSDETREACDDLTCFSYTYRCAYGACVNGNARCNDIRECADGSDEENCGATSVITPQTPTPSPRPSPTPAPTPSPIPTGPVTNGCRLPAPPEAGRYNVSGLETFNPGDIVGLFTVINFFCNSGYRVYPYENNLLFCTSGGWDKDLPECRGVCPSVSTTESVKVTCEIGDKSGEKYCENPVESTVATFSCQTNYEKASETLPSLYISRCEDGRWNRPTYECIPACGQRGGKGKPTILGGRPAQEHDFPWHVAIYNSTKGYLCGGSLIYYAERIIIVTAAHCVADLQNGTPFPKEDYLVALGKHYREYDDKRDSDSVQYPRIKNIYKHQLYRGEKSQHGGDIAIIELNDKVKINDYVQPVCMNWDPRKEYRTSDGWVIGWGYTVETGEPSDVLKVLDVPVLSNQECYDAVKEAFKPFVTYDKLCAGYLGEGKGVCSGDSGGGLVVREGTKYYLRGIVSVSPPSQTVGFCDKDSYAGYTDLRASNYIEFLQTS